MPKKRKGTPAKYYRKLEKTSPKHTRRKRAEALGRMTVSRATRLGYTVEFNVASNQWEATGHGLNTAAGRKAEALGAVREHWLRNGTGMPPERVGV